MNKFKLFVKKISLMSVLSLGFMVLGIVFISYIIVGFLAQPDYSEDMLVSKVYAPLNTLKVLDVVADNSIPLATAKKTLYPIYPEGGEDIGTLTMPTLYQRVPIIEGTTSKDLKKGVGHFAQSVLPGEKDNCVLSGHRETFFKKIGKLGIGDKLILETQAGTFTYEVSGTRIVDKDDRTVIVPTDHAVLTLTTCYPFNTPGYFPKRYIVSADLVKSE